MQVEAYAAFWDLLYQDGMGGVSLPYPGTVAWFEEHQIPLQDREPYRRLWRSLLAEFRKDRAEQREADERKREAARTGGGAPRAPRRARRW